MARDPITHVIVMDGTLSTLHPTMESNAGLTYRLLCETPASARLSLHYVEGIQWYRWRHLIDVAAGIGINAHIRRAYGNIASRYRPGDRIFLFGFSRGAYAVRSLAGIIDQIGLLKSEHATERHVRAIFRHYKRKSVSPGGQAFARRFCHSETPIEMIGVWDTVKSLGITYPLLWRLAPQPTDFHDHDLGPSVKHGYQALAMDENRTAFAPVMWVSHGDWQGHLEQAWFRGAHSDVGGDVKHFQAGRPLSNIPLVWMLERAEACGLQLPDGWRSRFPMDPDAPFHGSMRGLGKFYLLRKKRVQLADPSEYIHPSALSRRQRPKRRLWHWGKPSGGEFPPRRAVSEP
jgi:uncharacterized protein (DUF2235 family)